MITVRLFRKQAAFSQQSAFIMDAWKAQDISQTEEDRMAETRFPYIDAAHGAALYRILCHTQYIAFSAYLIL